MSVLWRSARFAAVAFAAVAMLPHAARGQSPARSYALVDGSSFQRGCFEPCECPIGQEQPLAGTFSLVPRSDYGTFAVYDVIDVHWKVEGNAYATPPGAAITGSGSYSLSSEFAVRQRLEAQLQVANEPPAAFDSGWVAGGGGFPDSSDVAISQNGKDCFDTGMHRAARVAEPLPEPAQTLQLLLGM